ncbi:MAG: hypothetical protein ABI273_03910 [Lacunisphaera sp.]
MTLNTSHFFGCARHRLVALEARVVAQAGAHNTEYPAAPALRCTDSTFI